MILHELNTTGCSWPVAFHKPEMAWCPSPSCVMVARSLRYAMSINFRGRWTSLRSSATHIPRLHCQDTYFWPYLPGPPRVGCLADSLVVHSHGSPQNFNGGDGKGSKVGCSGAPRPRPGDPAISTPNTMPGRISPVSDEANFVLGFPSLSSTWWLPCQRMTRIYGSVEAFFSILMMFIAFFFFGVKKGWCPQHIWNLDGLDALDGPNSNGFHHVLPSYPWNFIQGRWRRHHLNIDLWIQWISFRDNHGTSTGNHGFIKYIYTVTTFKYTDFLIYEQVF